MSEVVAVIDYGMGNLHSGASALEHVGATEVAVSHEPQAILEADRVVFPGVDTGYELLSELANLCQGFQAHTYTRFSCRA